MVFIASLISWSLLASRCFCRQENGTRFLDRPRNKLDLEKVERFYFSGLMIVVQPGLTDDEKRVVFSTNQISPNFFPRFKANFDYEL